MMQLEATKYNAANKPMNPPINGNKYMCSAVVKTKSSFPPTGMMVRKDSKSLKVFIVFTGDIYLKLTNKEYRLCRELDGTT